MTTPTLTTPVTIRLVSKSTIFPPADPASLGPALLDRVTLAINQQVKGDVCPAHNLDPALITIASGEPADGEWPLILADDQDPDALGWHSDAGTPGGWIGVQEILGYGGFPLVGSGPGAPSVASVIAHEVIEMLGDPLATLWSPMGDGRNVAFELCDPFQAFSYRMNGGDVEVSDFALPAWFDPNSKGPWSKCGNGDGPLKVASGGYMAIQNADGSVTQEDAYAIIERLMRQNRIQAQSTKGFWHARSQRKTSRLSRRTRKP